VRFSHPVSDTPVNLVLGEVLLEAGDPLGAVAVRARTSWLGGGLELHVTQRLLHQRLGEAWQRAGNADSASYHGEWAAKMGR
jgi:hypothetical protein